MPGPSGRMYNPPYSTSFVSTFLQSDDFLTSSYADDFTVSCSNSKIDQMAEALFADSPNIEEWVDERGLAISAPKSIITLITPQFAQSSTHPQYEQLHIAPGKESLYTGSNLTKE